MVEIESYVSLLFNKSVDNAGNTIKGPNFILKLNFVVVNNLTKACFLLLQNVSVLFRKCIYSNNLVSNAQ